MALPAIGALAGLAPLVLMWRATSPAAPHLLLGDIAVSSLSAATIAAGRGPPAPGWRAWGSWLACGALIGASLIGPVRLVPYVLVAASAFLLTASKRYGDRPRMTLRHSGVVATAAVVNFALLWPFTLGQYRPVDPARYLSLDLRAHALLADIPVHDVWYVHLPDTVEGRTLLDVNDAVTHGAVGDVPAALLAAIATYAVSARVAGLNKRECADRASSVAHRLTEADRARSVVPVGRGGFVYHFRREALLEIQTCTAHAIYVFALAPERGGYGLYWGVYVRRVSWVTPLYMGLIDPVRRLVVYPSLLQRFEYCWRTSRGADPVSAEKKEGAPRSGGKQL